MAVDSAEDEDVPFQKSWSEQSKQEDNEADNNRMFIYTGDCGTGYGLGLTTDEAINFGWSNRKVFKVDTPSEGVGKFCRVVYYEMNLHFLTG